MWVDVSRKIQWDWEGIFGYSLVPKRGISLDPEDSGDESLSGDEAISKFAEMFGNFVEEKMKTSSLTTSSLYKPLQ